MKKFTPHDFNYVLPEALIAQYPLPKRDQSRLLVLQRATQAISHQQFVDFIDFINPNDLLIFNDTKVIPARLHGRKQTGGKIECLIERILSKHRALAHVRASHAPLVGSELIFANEQSAQVLGRQNDLFELAFYGERPLLDFLQQYGEIPLPPYLQRKAEALDQERYQSVFAAREGAVAAPTASLHFDQVMLTRLRQKGVAMAKVTLHVGAGTFQPVRVEQLADHVMHKEYIEVSAELCAEIKQCKARAGRVFAIGTTVVRCLETAASAGEIKPYCGDTQLFIYPGYSFRCVDALLTNFHLPKSTLLMLVCALAGYEWVMSAYQCAIANGYRFFSYGDAMLLV